MINISQLLSLRTTKNPYVNIKNQITIYMSIFTISMDYHGLPDKSGSQDDRGRPHEDLIRMDFIFPILPLRIISLALIVNESNRLKTKC